MLEAKVEGVIRPLLDDLGIELYDMSVLASRGRSLLRVFIEKEGGVTIDDCERVSREIEALLDVEDPIPGPYTLEVSSPGLDRPLKTPEHFRRFSGSAARVVTFEPIENQTFFLGEILDAGETDIVMQLPGDRKVIIPYRMISKARLEVNV